MVRTILCQPVSEARVFSDEFEPTSVCCTSNGYVLLASNWGVIHVYAVDQSGCPRIHKFASNGIPGKLIYCEHGGHVVALENKLQDFKVGIHGKPYSQFRQVRVYLNWLRSPDQNDKYLISHRIGYSDNNIYLSSYIDKFLILDIPLKHSVNNVSCCDTTGNICLGAEAKVFVYKYKKVKVGESQGKGVVDFEITLEIDCGYQVRCVALCSDYIAFASLTELRVIQVFLSEDEQDQICQAEDVCQFLDDEKSSSSPTKFPSPPTPESTDLTASLDEHFVVWNIDQACAQSSEGLEQSAQVETKRRNNAALGSPTYVLKSTAITFDAIKDEPIYIDKETSAKEVFGPKATIPGHPIQAKRVSTSSGEFRAHEPRNPVISHVTLLYRRFQAEELSTFEQEKNGLHSVQWIPTFAKGPVDPNLSEQSVFGTSHEWALVSLGLFVSTPREGFLYELMNYSRQLAVYGYTGDCVAAQVSSKFLFAVTNNGLETYTVRLYSSAAETCTTLVRDGSLLRYRPGSFGSDQSRALSLLGASSLEFIPPKGNSFAGEDEYQKESQLEVQEEYFCSPPEVSNGEDTNIESVIELGNVKKVSGRKFMRKLQSNKKFSNSKAGNSANIDEWTSVENEVSELSLNDADKDSLRLPSSVYDIRELLKPCPSVNVEICLIGMYQLRGLSYVGCSDKRVILLVKTFEPKGKRGSVGKERSFPWNIYVLEITSAVDLHDEIMCLIQGSEFVNPNVYHQLMSEAHLCLRAELACNLPDQKKSNLKSAIRGSAAKMGDFFARCSSLFDYAMAKEYYKLAGQPLEDVLKRNSERDQEEKLAQVYGPGISEYLNQFIFLDDRDPLELSQESAEHILQIYKITQPSLLSKVILKSRLRNFTPDSAIHVLEELKTEEKQIGKYSLSSVDYVTLAILYLKLCNPDHSELMLKQIKTDQLTQVCATYPNIIWETDNILTPLGQLLRRHFSSVFSDLLVVLLDKGITDMQSALESLGEEDATEQSC